MTRLSIAVTLLFAGCALDTDPTEGSITSAVTEHTTNYVTSCANLALRSCDSPVGCDAAMIRMPFGTRLEIGDVNWNNRMARVLSSPFGSGWALSSLNGEPYISAAVPSHCE